MLCGILALSFACKSPENSSQSESSSGSGHTQSFTVKKAEEKYLYTSATCQKKALYYVSCDCGEKSDLYFEYGDYAPHAEITDEAIMPTCTETGLTEGKHCSVCKAVLVKQDVAPALGHTEVIDNAKPATCTETGLTEGKHCSVCNTIFVKQEVIPAPGHTEVTDNAKPATCLETGLTAGKHCSVCNTVLEKQETVPALGHNKIQHEAKAATCTESGYDAYETCSRCDYTTYKEIPKTEHSFAWIIDRTATEENTGLKHEECSSCHTKRNENTSIDKLDHIHVLIVVPAVASTCVKQGNVEYYHCSKCLKNYSDNKGQLLLADVKAPLAAHIESNFIIDKPAACLTAGSKHTQCTVCTLVIKTETIPALGHNEITHAAKEATCTESGYTAYETCSRCNYTTYKEIPAKGHVEVIDAGITPTRTDDGLTEGKHCSVCNTVIAERKIIHATGSIGLLYNYNVIVSIGSCTDSDIIIPRYSPENILVTAIGENAFVDSTAVSIFIPDTIRTIGARAFYNCANITEIHIPSSVTQIGTQIFYKASSLNTVYYDSRYSNSENPFLNTASINKIVFGGKASPSIIQSYKNITEVEISDGIDSISAQAFYNCSELTIVTIGSSVNYIGESILLGCNNLSTITIPFIGKRLYDSDIRFGHIFGSRYYENGRFVPKSLKVVNINNQYHQIKIKDNAFHSCSGLTQINIGDGVTSIGNYAFYGCSGLTSITIPDSVTSIGNYAFNGCNSLTSITIPDSVTSIGNYAFNGCNSLTSITIPDSVTSIGDSAFYYCIKLTNITIPNSVTSIGGSAFEGCSNLTDITIPDSVIYIGDRAFANCSGVGNITVHFDNSKFYSSNDCLIEKDTNTVILGCKNSNIPDSVTSIGNYAFYGCSKLTSITISDSVTSIGEWAFLGCNGLISITIGNAVTSIGDSAFYGCSGLTSITIPDSVTSIGDYTFCDCSGLINMFLSDNITSIGDSAFSGCDKLKKVFYNGQQKNIKIARGNDTLIDAKWEFYLK